MKVISVVVPVYYNEGSLAPLLDELIVVETRLQERDMGLELIFVDDGSGDNSLGELMKIKERRPATKIIKLTRNFGAIHATKTGFRFVTGDCFMNLAADLQDPPDLILKVIEPWERGSKFVLAVRSHREDPPSAKFFAWIYYVLLRLFVVSYYPRGGFDLALMDKALLPYLNNSSKNINTPLFAYWLGFKPDTIEYARRRREYGGAGSIVALGVSGIRQERPVCAHGLAGRSGGHALFVARTVGLGGQQGGADGIPARLPRA